MKALGPPGVATFPCGRGAIASKNRRVRSFFPVDGENGAPEISSSNGARPTRSSGHCFGGDGQLAFCVRAAALRAVFVTGAISGGPAVAETILDRAKEGDPSFIYKQYHHLAQPSGNDPAWYNFDHTFAWGMSVDGTHVAGESTAVCPSDSIDDTRSGCTRAAVWTPDFGSDSDIDAAFILPNLPLPGDTFWYRSQARAIDDNGETIVGQELVEYGGDESLYRAVAWSRAPGQSWQVSAQATELRPSGDYDAAGARGISGDGQYAVGWLGITTNFPRSGTEAALWRRTGPLGWTTAEPLGHLDDDDNTSSANGVAIDADGNPVVVGWSGENETIQQDVFRQGSDPGTDFIPGSSVSRVFCSDCQKRPFVWTEATGMEGLGLLDDDTKGDATAISADAKTIVGWSGWFASDEDKGSEAVRWVKSGGGDWSAVQPQGLGVFSLPTQFNSAAPDARPLGSVALAVSETGQAIVGYQTFGVDMGRGLSPRFNLAFIWTEALGTGHYLGDVLTDAGVTLGDWVLYTATGVRETNEFFVVVGDGCQGSAEDCLQAFDPPGYIARIGRDADSPSGITTPVEQMISFTELSTAAMAIGTNVANTLRA